MAEHPVQNQADAGRRRRPLQTIKRRIAAELGVHFQVIPRVVFMIGHRGKNWVHIEYRNSEAF